MKELVEVLGYTILELEHFIIYFKENEGSDTLVRTVAFLEAENKQLKEAIKRLADIVRYL